MLNRKNRRLQNERLDQFGRELLRAATMTEAEVQAIASSPFLYQRWRARMATRPKQQTLTPRWLIWGGISAAVLILVVAVIAPPVLPTLSPKLTQPADTTPQASRPAPPADESLSQTLIPDLNRESERARPSASQLEPPRSRHTVSRSMARHHTNDRDADAELAIDLSLSIFGTDPAVLDSGHVVRVELARSALLSLGLPLDDDVGSDPIKVDVVLSEDGVALAIRLLI